MKSLSRLITLMSVAFAAAAVAEQLKRPPEERTWHGEVMGLVPYDFRIPTLDRIRERCWNPDDPRLFTPHVFGVGWTINFFELRRRAVDLLDEGEDG
jgi:hypothetical protein